MIGIDKLVLTSRDYSVSDASPAYFSIDKTIRQGSKNEELPHLLTDARGRQINAHKIYHNSTEGSYTINQYGLNITFNPDKLINPYLLSDIGGTGFTRAVETIDAQMRKIGISANLNEMKLSRVDLAKQAEMIHPSFTYSPAFKLFSAKRKMKQRNYLETHTIGNTQHQVCFYDKEAELNSLGLKYVMQGEKNLMRAEIRFLKTNSTQRNLEVKTLGELHKISSADMNEIYSTYMNKNIFSRGFTSEQLVFDFHKEVELLKYLREVNPYKALTQFLILSNLDEYLIKVGGVQGFSILLDAAGYSRSQVSRIKKEIDKLIALKGSIDRQRNIVSLPSLVDELKIKFAA